MTKKEKDSGSISIKGNIGAGTAIGHGANVEAQNIAGRDINIGADTNEVVKAFAAIYKTVDNKQFDSDEVKEEVVSSIRSIESQNKKGEEANESILKIKFQTLAIMAPDILEVVIATLTNPSLGISTVVKKIAEKAKETLGGAE